MAEYRMPLPGRLYSRAAFVDVETEKVPTPEGYRMPNGEVLRKRWAVTMVAVVERNYLVLGDGPEEDVLEVAATWLSGQHEVWYAGTREFDEMILRGRFTNARRAHLPRPTWPAMDGAEAVPWVNARGMDGLDPWWKRGPDVKSRDVPEVLRNGGPYGWERCAIHCLRDALDLALRHGAADDDVCVWGGRVMSDYQFAKTVLLTADREEV